jgi:membrane-bound lytic murein transglycosylase MltF
VRVAFDKPATNNLGIPCALLLAIAIGACSRQAPQQQAPDKPSGSTAAANPAVPPDDNAPPANEAGIPEVMRSRLHEPFSGDFDEMLKRRMIRAGVTFNRTFFFVDKGVLRGVSAEYLRLFEDELNQRLKTGNLKIHVVPIPMPRGEMLSALNEGKVDLLIAQLTVTPERQKLVDFTNPTRTNVNEVLVTGPGSTPIASLDGLSGKTVFVRKASVYAENLRALNQTLQAKGKPPIHIEEGPDNLEDDDMLEMVNSGLIPATVVDSYLADFWKQVFKDLVVHDASPITTGGILAVAMRKNSPKLAQELNTFIAKNGLNSVIGRVLNKRYLENTKFATNATSEAERKRFQSMVDLFRKYGDQYQFDYLLMAAQGFQESRLDQNAKSQVGAVGVMQLMPATGKEQKVGDIRQLAPNIHAGVKYMRFMRDQIYADEPMDELNKGLFTFASYNAGPGRIASLRREAARRGLNQNVWFGNVEQVASEKIGRETVTYVSNIYKYYIAYKLVVDEAARRKASKAALTKKQ